MSAIVDKAVEKLSAKLTNGFDGLAKIVIKDEGSVILDESGARAGDDDADVTLIASADTFMGIVEGNVNPTMAFMTGKLKVEGSMGLAMKLASALAG